VIHEATEKARSIGMVTEKSKDRKQGSCENVSVRTSIRDHVLNVRPAVLIVGFY